MTTVTTDNWRKILDLLEHFSKKVGDYQGHYIQFRGQSNANWKLDTSIKRVVAGDEISEKKALFYEHMATTEFISQSHLLSDRIAFSVSNSPNSLEVDMQHFSCPTRLLDWSGSPFVALYFAVSENLDNDGALYIWDVRSYNQTVEVLCPGYSEINSNEIKRFQGMDIIQLVFPTVKNERIVRQQGCFSISNNILKSHCELIEEIFTDNSQTGLFKLIIPADLKLECLRRLRTMNIAANSLFPGTDGLGKSIREQLLLRRYCRM